MRNGCARHDIVRPSVGFSGFVVVCACTVRRRGGNVSCARRSSNYALYLCNLCRSCVVRVLDAWFCVVDASCALVVV